MTQLPLDPKIDKERRHEAALRKSLAEFDDLPSGARVKVPVACRITARSRSAWYADSSAGRAPPILKLCGGRASGVNVGELRRFLADPESYRAPAQVAA